LERPDPNRIASASSSDELMLIIGEDSESRTGKDSEDKAGLPVGEDSMFSMTP
jgi:hypothetical protein